jgi:hypothetical protein
VEADEQAGGDETERPRGCGLVGYRIAVWWEGDEQWFGGVVKSYSRTRGHAVEYKDELKYHKLDNDDEDEEWEEWAVECAPPAPASGAATAGHERQHAKRKRSARDDACVG